MSDRGLTHLLDWCILRRQVLALELAQSLATLDPRMAQQLAGRVIGIEEVIKRIEGTFGGDEE